MSSEWMMRGGRRATRVRLTARDELSRRAHAAGARLVAAFRVCLLAGVVGHVRVHLAGLGVLLLDGSLLVLGYLRLLLGIGSVTAGDRSFLLSLGLGLAAKRGLFVGQRALALSAHAPGRRIPAQLGGLLTASLQPASAGRTAQQRQQHDHYYDSNHDGNDGSCAHRSPPGSYGVSFLTPGCRASAATRTGSATAA